MHFYNNFRKECLRHGRFDVLCGIVVAILHVSHRQAIGSPWVYPWMGISMDISIHGYSHGYPRKNLWIWTWIWMGNFISTASLAIPRFEP